MGFETKATLLNFPGVLVGMERCSAMVGFQASSESLDLLRMLNQKPPESGLGFSCQDFNFVSRASFVTETFFQRGMKVKRI